MPLALKIVMCPWNFETFLLVVHSVSRVSSQNCRSAWILGGVWGYLSHVRHCSPPGMSLLCETSVLLTDSWPPTVIPPGNTVNQLPWTSISLSGGLGRVLPSVKYRHNSYKWCTWTGFVLNEHKVTALCCQQSGGWEPGKCHTFAHCFSVREHNFHLTLEVGCQVAVLYQLMVMLGLDCNLVTWHPHTMGPTLGTKFVLWVVPLPSMGDGSCSGPMVGVDRKPAAWLERVIFILHSVDKQCSSK